MKNAFVSSLAVPAFWIGFGLAVFAVLLAPLPKLIGVIRPTIGRRSARLRNA